MEHLQDFTLDLRSDKVIDHETIDVHERMHFPHVRRLRLKTELHLPYEDRSAALKRALFSSLFFPGVVDLRVEMLGYDPFSWDSDESDSEFQDPALDFYFNKEIHRIFRHVDQFPHVNTFLIKLGVEHRGDGDSRRDAVLCVPLNMLFNLKHFTLESTAWRRLEMREPDDPDEIAFEDERRVAKRVVGDVLPVLDTITLDVPYPRVVAGWVGDYLEGVRKEGRAGLRELIVMEEDESRDRRKVFYIGDDAIEWSRCHR